MRDLTLNVSYKWVTLTASYEHLTNPITQWNYLTETDAMLCKHINLDKPINTYSAYLAVTPHVGIWSLNATAGFEKQDLYLDVEASPFRGDGRGLIAFITTNHNIRSMPIIRLR